MANNITEVLHQIQETTKANLLLLKTINESFYTQREHVSTIINGEKYTLPSFIYLESKLNVLEENFKNLVNAPQTGEAAFVFDGNTQSIAMQRYTTTPKSLKLKDVETFDIKENALFKDLVTPNLYVRLNVEDIPNDITHVVVKKVTINDSYLQTRVKNAFTSGKKSYLNLHNILKGSTYISGKDYVEYDTEMRLPSITEERYGEYHVKSVVSQDIDVDFIQHYTVIIDRDPVFHYTLGTETGLQDYIKVGDTLLCNNGTVKLRVDEIVASERLLRLTVLNNAYANITPYIDNTQDDTGVLTYFTDITNNNKYVDVTLEEDDYVAIFIAPLNKMNVRASFGDGILINANEIRYTDSRGTVWTYRKYYDSFVNNVGDTLANLTKVFNNNIFQMPYDEISKLLKEKPVLTKDSLKVLELNTHLKDNTGVEELIKYDADKINTKDEIKTIQNQIDDLRSQIKNGKFTGEISGRADAETRLAQLENDLDNKNSQLVDLINTISKTTNNNDLSASNIKYRIRGFYDVSEIERRVDGHKVIRIIVQYQYASKSTNMTGGARAITTKDGNIDYLISDWTTMESPYLCKEPQIKTVGYPVQKENGASGKIKIYNVMELEKDVVVDYPTSNMNQNEPSFNQIDIPINAGEIVNIRVRVQYEDGYPFFETLSEWSNTISIPFPTEYETAKPLLTIIEENISDADKYRFIGAMEEYNVIEHVRDEVVTEEGATFFHKCEHVTSGFYTSERRDIPLRDKLQEMDALLNTLENEIYGVQANELKVTLSDQRSTIELKRDSITSFVAPGYDWSNGKRDTYGNAQRIINLTLTNTSNYNINLYSMFPGAMSSNLTSVTKSRFETKDYCVDNPIMNTNGETIIKDLRGVWMECFSKNNLDSTHDFVAPSQPAINFCNQHLNQFLYFRINNPNDGTKYYDSGPQWDVDNVLSLDRPLSPMTSNVLKMNNTVGASLLPMLNDIKDITIPTGTNKKVLKPGESVSIALDFRYLLSSVDEKNRSIEKTMSFDIRPSLYADPINYTFKVCANFYDTLIPATSRTTIAAEDFIIRSKTSAK